MKPLISLLLTICLFASSAFADCDFKTGIKNLPDGNYEYTKDCHIQVGLMKQTLDNDQQAITDLKKAIDLKDLAVKASDDRTQLWMDTAFKMEQRTESIDNLRKNNEILYFGLGVLTTFLAAYASSQMLRH